jgi:hypothetical protein
MFCRRRYTVEGADLDKAKSIEVTVKVNGKVMVQVAAREPGIVAMVSRPDDQGFEIDMVEPAKGNFIDAKLPGDKDDNVAPWQLEALGLPQPT